MKNYLFTRTNWHLRRVMAEIAGHSIPEIWLLYGPTGAGKTTLIRHSLGELPEGSVFWTSGERILEDLLRDVRIGVRCEDSPLELRYPGEILVIEDIECWKGKEETLYAIGRVLRQLEERGKTIVLTSLREEGLEELGVRCHGIYVPKIPVDSSTLEQLCQEYRFRPTRERMVALRAKEQFYEAEGLVKYYLLRRSMEEDN